MEVVLQSCPLCGTELSKVKFVEIQAKLRDQKQQELLEQKKNAAQVEATVRLRLEAGFKKELQTARQDAAKAAKQELDEQIKKIAAERDQANKRAKDAEKEKESAAKAAKQQADEQIKKITIERDEANKKVKEAVAREAQIREEAKEEAQKKREKELAGQRAVLEKDKAMALLKQQGEFNREREAFQKKVKVMEHQLQKKTANELGDGGEIDVFEALREAFPGDRITRIKKGQPGADILHEVLHKGQLCGRIVIDSKVRQGWQNGFITKLRQDQVEAGAEQAILATSVFPSGTKELCIDSDIIIANPARVVHITDILRKAMITMHVRGLSMKERADKMGKLYRLITSEAYGRKFNEAGRLTQDILELDVQEKKTHDNVWKKRGTLATKIKNVLREIETDVAAVIEGDEDVPSADPYPAQSVKIPSASTSAERR